MSREIKYTDVPGAFNLPESVLVEKLVVENGQFHLICSSRDVNNRYLNTLAMVFVGGVFAFRSLDEGDYLASGPAGKQSFYRVENSEFLSWFDRESLGVRRDRGLMHFAVYTAAECFDIISDENPVFSWLD